jgi:starvation-inducible DNA-binding protein
MNKIKFFHKIASIFSITILLNFTPYAMDQSSDIPSDIYAQNQSKKEENNMKINIDISDQNRKKVAELLNSLLSDEFLIYVKTLNFHWNVKSRHFRDAHAFFKEQYEALLNISDDIAERIRSIDEVPFATMQQFLSNARLSESPKDFELTDQEMIAQLLKDYEAVIRQIRIDQEKCIEYGDMASNNFLLNLLEKQEKMAWMLRASLVK